MRVFRIEREKYLNETLLGIGASMSSNFRWNSRFTQMVYTAESRALALLEITVHLPASHLLPSDRFVVEIDIPENVPILDLDVLSLPLGWNDKPPRQTTQIIGDQFVSEQAGAILRVPSVIVPHEFNYLINPLHPEAKHIQKLNAYPIVVDKRL
jgi:RES domain-containing protein